MIINQDRECQRLNVLMLYYRATFDLCILDQIGVWSTHYVYLCISEIRYSRSWLLGSVLLIFFIFCVVFLCFICLRPVSIVVCVWIVPVPFSLTFIWSNKLILPTPVPQVWKIVGHIHGWAKPDYLPDLCVLLLTSGVIVRNSWLEVRIMRASGARC